MTKRQRAAEVDAAMMRVAEFDAQERARHVPTCGQSRFYSNECTCPPGDPAMTTTTPVGIKVAHCGCRVAMARGTVNGMLWCPIHAAAGEMRESIRQLVRMIDPRSAVDVALLDTDALAKARAILARLGG